MAARLNPRQDERTRSAIRSTELVKRLQQFSLGLKDEAGQVVRMNADQVRAALGLLKKTIPDLVLAQLTGKDGGPIQQINFNADLSPADAAREYQRLMEG